MDLLNEEIPNDITLNAAFQGEFNATQSRFLRTLDLSGSTFECHVDFQNATVESDFVIDNCHFNFYSSDTSPFFAGIRVGRDWLMEQGVQFHAVPDFTQAVVEGKLLATGATFQAGAEFNDIRVKGDCLLREAIFGGGQADFVDSHFNNLFLNDSHFEKTSLMDLTRIQVESIFLDKVTYPSRGSVVIEGMTFRSMSPASWDGLQGLTTHSDYDPEFYTNLETLFRSHGHNNQADKVYLAKQRHDRSAICPSLLRDCQRVKWTFGLLEDGLTGYGRSLENLLLWSIGFILFGTWAFRRSAMKRVDSKDTDILTRPAKLRYWRARRWLMGIYGGFWYSLDLFLPIIELGEREKWEPQDNRRWAVLYKKVHAIIGHLFVPIGLAAWTGIIR